MDEEMDWNQPNLDLPSTLMVTSPSVATETFNRATWQPLETTRTAAIQAVKSTTNKRAPTGQPDVGVSNQNSKETAEKRCADSENSANEPPTPFLALMGASMILSLGLCLSFAVICSLRRSSWKRRKCDLAVWMKREDGVANRVDKEIVKVGWTTAAADDFECWSSSPLLLSGADETEHERLLLAVTPHHSK